MATGLKDSRLIPSKSPNLPIAPVAYDQRYQDAFLNALRLYFAQVDNFSASLANDTGGKYLTFPHIAAGGLSNQYATGNNIPTLVTFDTLFDATSFTLNSNGTATVVQSGTYKITYSLQFANNNNVNIDAPVWIRVNGVDVAGSATIFTVPARKSAGVPSYVCGYSEVVFDMYAGDNIGLWWGTPTAATSGGTLGVYMFAQAAQTSPMAYPSTPSAIGSITFVSAL